MSASSSEQNKDRKQENFYCSTNKMVLGALLVLVFALIIIFILMNCNKTGASPRDMVSESVAAKYLLTSTPDF
jgi:hypothetical protein